jgi:hypothetical protein
MPQARRKRRSKQSYRRHATPISHEVAQEEAKPVRGVKLKTVSAFTMFFALSCLAAFMAGRPPVSAAASMRSTAQAHMETNQQRLRHDNARRLFGRALGKREPGAKKIEKSAGTRTPIRFLFANAQQKNQQAKNI